MTGAGELDQLIESVAVASQIATGAKRAVIAAQTANRRLALVTQRQTNTHAANASAWSDADDDFVRAHWGKLTIEEIAQRLGRTWASVKIRQTRVLRLDAPTKGPNILTANMVAYGLGLDSHAVLRLIERGILAARVWPYRNGRKAYLVDRLELTTFVVNPRNWIYFSPELINCAPAYMLERRDAQKYPEAWFEQLREMVLRRKAAWTDEWWTPGQVAAYHGCHHSSVNNAIHDGRLPAVKWGNWRILRSDAMALKQIIAWTGKGGLGQERAAHTPRSNAFLVLAAALGLPNSAIGPLMKIDPHNIDYRLRMLRRRGRLPWLIRHHELPVHINRQGEILADWKWHKDRFPRLAQAMKRLRRGEELAPGELLIVRSVLQAWARFFARNKEHRAIVKSLHNLGRRQCKHFRAVYERMRAAGIDPYRRLRD